ncbi:MAG: SEC-C metal-binding domain-containing protein [bacterium]|nr:SEC-C metal-binding domain-containing protein [bacterium]
MNMKLLLGMMLPLSVMMANVPDVSLSDPPSKGKGGNKIKKGRSCETVYAGGGTYEKPEADNVGRNEPCPCFSGKKYKKCCMKTKQV